jgi:hypothetical protein
MSSHVSLLLEREMNGSGVGGYIRFLFWLFVVFID